MEKSSGGQAELQRRFDELTERSCKMEAEMSSASKELATARKFLAEKVGRVLQW